MGIEPVQFSRRRRQAKHLHGPVWKKARDIKEGEQAGQQKKSELDGIGPDHRFDPADASINQRQKDKQQNGAQNRGDRRQKRPGTLEPSINCIGMEAT